MTKHRSVLYYRSVRFIYAPMSHFLDVRKKVFFPIFLHSLARTKSLLKSVLPSLVVSYHLEPHMKKYLLEKIFREKSPRRIVLFLFGRPGRWLVGYLQRGSLTKKSNGRRRVTEVLNHSALFHYFRTTVEFLAIRENINEVKSHCTLWQQLYSQFRHES